MECGREKEIYACMYVHKYKMKDVNKVLTSFHRYA